MRLSPPSRLVVVALASLVAVATGACTPSGEDGHLVPRTVASDPSLPRFELRDGRLLHLRTLGDPASPVLIVLHGGPGGDHRDYASLESFADRGDEVVVSSKGAPEAIADLCHLAPQRREVLEREVLTQARAGSAATRRPRRP